MSIPYVRRDLIQLSIICSIKKKLHKQVMEIQIHDIVNNTSHCSKRSHKKTNTLEAFFYILMYVFEMSEQHMCAI